MRTLLLFALAPGLWAQAPSNGLSVTWLVREDLFAGMLDGDRERFKKGLETLDAVASYYPEAELLGWRYMAAATQAVWAHEAKDSVTFNRQFGIALTHMNRLRKLAVDRQAALPEIYEGAVMLVLADRLPEALRAGAKERAYQAYAKLGQLEVSYIENMPMHMKGESLSGFATTAFMTGRNEEAVKAFERVATSMPKTPYGLAAKKWLEDPESRGKVKTACLSCHEPNRLGARVEKSHK